jgi:hypothetical protein
MPDPSQPFRSRGHRAKGQTHQHQREQKMFFTTLMTGEQYQQSHKCAGESSKKVAFEVTL